MRYGVVGVVVLLVLSTGGVATTDSGATTVTLQANDVDDEHGDHDPRRLPDDERSGDETSDGHETGDADQRPAADLQVRWTTDPEADQPLQSNHHTPAVTRFRNETYVAVPVNSRHGTVCALSVLDGDGDRRWRVTVPDPTIADYDTDGRPEVLAATSEKVLVAYDLATGDEELRKNLTSYGYAKPIVTDLTGDGRPETVVVDLLGGVFVLRPDGETVWHRTLDDARVRQPGVADYDADGRPELVVGLLSGPVTLLERDGARAWRTNVSGSVSTRWLASGRLDDDPAVEVAVATYTGHVAVLDGADGAVEWTLDLGASSGGLGAIPSGVDAVGASVAASVRTRDGALLHGTTGAAVHAVGDGDGDGRGEVYPVARDGVLYAVDGANGSVEWTRRLSDPPVGVAPPPSMGDVDADGDPELVAVTDEGRVAVVDPDDGSVLATYGGDAPIRTFPRIADVDGDGEKDVLVLYGDGRVVALSYDASA